MLGTGQPFVLIDSLFLFRAFSLIFFGLSVHWLCDRGFLWMKNCYYRSHGELEGLLYCLGAVHALPQKRSLVQFPTIKIIRCRICNFYSRNRRHKLNFLNSSLSQGKAHILLNEGWLPTIFPDSTHCQGLVFGRYFYWSISQGRGVS